MVPKQADEQDHEEHNSGEFELLSFGLAQSESGERQSGQRRVGFEASASPDRIKD